MKFALPVYAIFVLIALVFVGPFSYGQKKSTVDSLNKLISSKKIKDTTYIRALNSLAWIYSKTDSAKSINYAQQAKKLSETKNYKLGLAEAYRAIGNAYGYKNRTLIAIENFDKSNSYFQSLNNQYEIAANYNSMGFAYKIVGEVTKALIYFNKAEKIHRKMKKHLALSSDMNNIGSVYETTGNYEKAITAYLESVRLCEKMKKPQQTAQTYINMGSIMRNQKNYKEASSYFNSAIKILIDFNDQLNLGIAYLNYANNYIEQSQHDIAIQIIEKSMAAFQKADFKRGMQICYNNLGALNMRQKRYKEAIPLLEKSIAIAEEAKNFVGLALVQQNIAFSYTQLGDYQLAEKWFDKAEASALKYKADKYTTGEIYFHRSSLDSAQGNFQKAFFLREKYRLTKDSLLNEKLSKQVNELNTKYQTERKQNEITLLSKQNQIQGLEINEGKLEILNQNLLLDRDKLELNEQGFLIERSKGQIARKELESVAKGQKIKILNKENRIQKLTINNTNILLATSVGMLLLITLLAFLFYNRYKLKQETKLQAEVLAQQDLATKAVLSAEENERKRISGELHDGLGQMFSAVKMNLSALTDGLTFKDEHSREMFGKTMNLVDDSCKEVRSISHQMAPNALLKSGLAVAVRDFINKIDSRKLKINLETVGLQERLDQNVETVLYRVIQESVNNVIKHSGANILDIQLTKDEDGINAMIEDNGKGFDINQLKSEGIGLKNIRSRVEYLKGTVDFSSTPQIGTLVAIYIPL